MIVRFKVGLGNDGLIKHGLAKAALSAALIALAGCATSPPVPTKGPSHRPSMPSHGVGSEPLAKPAKPAAAPVPKPAPPPVAKAPVPAKPAVPGANAAGLGVLPGPALAEMGVTPDRAKAALLAFRSSCPALLARTDISGLTTSQDWRPLCAEAMGWPEDKALDFFATRFETAVVGDGKSLVTGYYNPEIRGARVRQPGYDVPIYRRPADLVDVDLGAFTDALKGKRIAGRVEGRRLLPYADRRAIDEGALAGKGLELAWAADPVDLFFLQIQGSGRLKLPDGSIMRIGYDGYNGRDFTGLGRFLLDRGLLPSGQASMQGIMAYLRAQPDGGRALMHENKSVVFFREIPGEPVGALGVEVIGQVSAAADPAFVPLGAPFVVALDFPAANGLWVAQDTGGAIKGANRFDTFWGAGDAAARIAGGLAARGQAWLLLPKGVLARIGGGGRAGSQPQR